ncbi:MAG TPA: hypothetical protein PLQ34_09995 [Ferrovaceae bacterium]|nr:hypothetical protein [Ferrovaceae bacterium]
MSLEKPQDDWKKLQESRLKVCLEMKKAIRCKTVEEKKRLVEEWKAKYPPLVFKELLALAKSPSKYVVAKWDKTFNLSETNNLF